MHPGGETTVDLRNSIRVFPLADAFLPCGGQLIGHAFHEILGIEHTQPLEKLRIAQSSLRHRWNLKQDMEVVRHHAVGKHPAAAEILHHPHEHPEFPPLLIPEHEPPVNHP